MIVRIPTGCKMACSNCRQHSKPLNSSSPYKLCVQRQNSIFNQSSDARYSDAGPLLFHLGRYTPFGISVWVCRFFFYLILRSYRSAVAPPGVGTISLFSTDHLVYAIDSAIKHPLPPYHSCRYPSCGWPGLRSWPSVSLSMPILQKCIQFSLSYFWSAGSGSFVRVTTPTGRRSVGLIRPNYYRGVPR